jgi:spore cortex biosynthesis protein YabQ
MAVGLGESYVTYFQEEVKVVLIQEQVTVFALTIGIGLLAGLIYDLYRVLRLSLRLKRTGVFLGDLLFCFFLTAFVFGLLILINYGEVRFYVILGMALGALTYFNLLNKTGYQVILKKIIRRK